MVRRQGARRRRDSDETGDFQIQGDFAHNPDEGDSLAQEGNKLE